MSVGAVRGNLVPVFRFDLTTSSPLSLCAFNVHPPYGMALPTCGLTWCLVQSREWAQQEYRAGIAMGQVNRIASSPDLPRWVLPTLPCNYIVAPSSFLGVIARVKLSALHDRGGCRHALNTRF